MAAVLAFAIGASLGSFVNVLIDRLPEGRSIVRPRSSCDACHRELGSLEMIPIVSYLVLRGKCSACGVRIPVRVLFVELATGSMLFGLYLQHGLGLTFAVLSMIFIILIAITFIDYYHQLILNVMTYPAALAALILSLFWPELGFDRTWFGFDGALASFYNSLATATIAFLLFLLLAAVARMGYGDVKLVLVLGLLLGYPALIISLWIGIVVGGVVGLALIFLGGRSRKDAIPFGPFLAGGAIVAFYLLGWITERYQGLGLGGFVL